MVVAEQNLARKTAIEMMRLLSTGRPLGQVFPNVAVLAKIYQLIPVSTADSERGFLTHDRNQTKSRNSLSIKMLNVRLLLVEEPDLDNSDFEAACQIWMQKPRQVNVKVLN